MEQSDLILLQNVPPYHLQAVVKSRHLSHFSPLSQSPKGQNTGTEFSSMLVTDIAQYLFDPSALREILQNLNEVEELILHELVACGGRANSRDLALYLNLAGALRPTENRNPGETATHAGVSEERSVASIPALPLQYPTPHPHGVFEQALHRLLVLGLLFWGKQTNFIGRDYANGVYDGVLIVPQAVLETVNEILQDQSVGEGTHEEYLYTGALPTAPNLWWNLLQRSLYLYWSLASSMREGLLLVNNRLLSRPALRQVIEQLSPIGVLKSLRSPLETSRVDVSSRTGLLDLQQVRSETEVPYLLFIRLLLMKLGLLTERNGALFAAPADAFFSLTSLERTRRCYHLWLEDPFWNELTYLPDVIVRPGPAPLEPAHQEAVRARQVVVERVLNVGLSTRPSKGILPESEQAGNWHELAAFIARTKLYAPNLLFPRQYGLRTERYSTGSNPYGWDFRLRRGWLTHREGWHQVEGGFIRAVVLGPLLWLGLIEVNSEDNPTAFRLTPGAPLITSEISIEEAPPGRLIVQPNFELVALAPLSELLLSKLDRFAERLSLEHIAQYRLTKASVTRAIQMGLHADSIQQVLEQAAGDEIPQNVRYSLVEWERQARRIELWRGVALLEVDDAALLDALFAGEETHPFLGRRLSPLLAEVASDHLEAVQEVLWRRDYLPALATTPLHDNLIESGRFPLREPQWKLLEDGFLQPKYAVLDLYLVSELGRITEPGEITSWRRVTPSSIQQACQAGLPLEHIIGFLQSYCEGGVPASFLIRLKLWGGGYGEQHTIQVEPSPLLSLSQQVLRDLQADEELGELLGTEVSQENRLVHVVPGKLERVIELLRQRGFFME